jgi:hypothetical protein
MSHVVSDPTSNGIFSQLRWNSTMTLQPGKKHAGEPSELCMIGDANFENWGITLPQKYARKVPLNPVVSHHFQVYNGSILALQASMLTPIATAITVQGSPSGDTEAHPNKSDWRPDFFGTCPQAKLPKSLRFWITNSAAAPAGLPRKARSSRRRWRRSTEAAGWSR